jgi:hypothetical protein
MAGTHVLIGIGNQNGKIGSKKGPESGIPRNSGGIPNQASTLPAGKVPDWSFLRGAEISFFSKPVLKSLSKSDE